MIQQKWLAADLCTRMSTENKKLTTSIQKALRLKHVKALSKYYTCGQMDWSRITSHNMALFVNKGEIVVGGVKPKNLHIFFGETKRNLLSIEFTFCLNYLKNFPGSKPDKNPINVIKFVQLYFLLKNSECHCQSVTKRGSPQRRLKILTEWGAGGGCDQQPPNLPPFAH